VLYQIASVPGVWVLGIFVSYRFPFHLIAPMEILALTIMQFKCKRTAKYRVAGSG